MKKTQKKVRLKKITPVKAWAIIDSKKRKLDVLDVFTHNDVRCEPSEELIRVEIRPI